jgi:hypothetical protein
LALTPTKDRTGSDEAFLREVDDAVRASDLTSFWKNYGRWLLGAVIIGLIAFAGYIFYSQAQQAANDMQSELFIAAVDKLKAGDHDNARKDLTKIVGASQPGYRAMAQLLLANLDGEKGNPTAALAGYKKVASDTTLPGPMRDMALLRQTALELDTLPPQKVIDQLKPLAVAGNPWFGSAGEMSALAYIKLGKENLAGPIFAQIAKQEDVPSSIRSRAQQMAGSLGFDAVQVDDNKDKATGSTVEPAKGNNK